MRITNPKRGRASLAGLAMAVTLFALSACSAPTAEPFNLTTDNAGAVACDQVKRVINTVGALDESAKPGERNGGLRDWGLDPKNKEQISAVRSALREQDARCDKAREDAEKASASPSPTVSTSTSASPSPSATGTPGKEIGVEQPDGSFTALPIVGKPGEAGPDNGDTTGDPRTPATFTQVKDLCGDIRTWKNLVDCVDKAGAEWYKGAVNDRAPKTGFNWADIKKWANDPQLDGTAQLGIVVFGDIADQNARVTASKLVGDDLADDLAITKVSSGQWVNTRSAGHEQVGDFVDPRVMTRVSLLPVQYGRDGKVAGLAAKSGIFIDCLNVWWQVKRTWTCQDSSCAPPPKATKSPSPTPSGKTTPPRPTPKPTPTPSKSKLAKKKTSQDPANKGNVPDQAKGKAPGARDDHKQPTRPPDPPAKYTPPPTPKPSTPPAESKPTPKPTQSPAPGANDPGNGGKIPEPED